MLNIFKPTKFWKDVVFILIGIGAILYCYQDLPGVYYMHDEWRTQASVLIGGVYAGLNYSRPLGAFINNLIYYYFPLRAHIFIVLSYALHIVNYILLYFLTQKYSKNIYLAFIASLLFATSSSGQQAVSWVGAGVQTLGSVMFSLLALYLLHLYVFKRKFVYIFTALVLGLISFLLKETGVILLPFFLVALAVGILRSNTTFSTLVRYIQGARTYVFIATAGLVTTCFLLPLLVHQTFFTTWFFNCLYYPFVSLSQSIIPIRFMYRLGAGFLSINYPIISHYNDAPTIGYFITTDTVSIIFSSIFCVVLYFFYKRTKYKSLFVVGLSWYILSFMPLAYSLISRNSSYIDSRHMYMPMVGVSIMVAICILTLIKILKNHVWSKILIYVLIGILCTAFIKQFTITKREVKETAISGIQMTTFIRSFNILNKYRSLPSKPVFYFESNRNYYYEGNKLPFLLGSGFVIGVIEYPTGKIPGGALIKGFLVDFGSQGYFESADKAYGYYYDYLSLIDGYRNKLFQVNQINGYKWNSDSNKLIDITDQVRIRLNEEE